MKKIELLAPCGTMESLYAAVQNGANAVYLGGSKFSARAYAANFDEENMIKAVNYCHLYGVKIYVTVNTLLKEDEIKDALIYVGFLQKIGVDALIVQDTGLIYLIKNNFPNLELHASTQMTIHNEMGAKYFIEKGFKRVVLSREISLNEIEHISKDLKIETEIFVHGALCVSYSGQCLMSSLIGGRSGNRGRCAQSCRMPYTIEKDSEEIKGYLLSPKDMCTLPEIHNIIKTGTSSLKIEGRMKRPEYVAGVTSIYREAIDSFYENRNFDYEYGVKKLKQLFNRQGFSKAYLFKNTGRDMMAYSFPKNTGVELGKVNNDLTINLLEDLNVKDGIRVNNSDNGFQVSKILKNSREIEGAHKTEKVKILGGNYKKDDVLYKTSDFKLLESLKDTYKDVYGKKFDLNINCSFKIGDKFKLNCNYRGKDYTVGGEVVQKALKKPVSKENLILNLKKTGNTPYIIKEVNFIDYEDGFLPISKINEARRELIDEIEKSLLNVACEKKDKALNLNREQKKDGSFEKLIVGVQNMEQLKAALKCNVYNIMIDFSMRKCDIKVEDTRDFNLYIKIPSIVKGEYKNVEKFIMENIENIKGIITANTGIINEFKGKTHIIADYKLNLFNRYSLDFYKNDIDAAYLSVELKRSEILKTVKSSPIPLGVVVYGKLEAMVCEYCPVGSTFGKRSTDNACSENCAINEYNLKDRLGERFLVRTDRYCRSHIYNSKALNLIPNIKDNCLSNLNHRIDFVDESSEEVITILKDYKECKCSLDREFTKGHYKRGVE